MDIRITISDAGSAGATPKVEVSGDPGGTASAPTGAHDPRAAATTAAKAGIDAGPAPAALSGGSGPRAFVGADNASTGASGSPDQSGGAAPHL